MEPAEGNRAWREPSTLWDPRKRPGLGPGTFLSQAALATLGGKRMTGCGPDRDAAPREGEATSGARQVSGSVGGTPQGFTRASGFVSGRDVRAQVHLRSQREGRSLE